MVKISIHVAMRERFSIVYTKADSHRFDFGWMGEKVVILKLGAEF